MRKRVNLGEEKGYIYFLRQKKLWNGLNDWDKFSQDKEWWYSEGISSKTKIQRVEKLCHQENLFRIHRQKKYKWRKYAEEIYYHNTPPPPPPSPMMDTLVNKSNFNGMNEYGDKLLQGSAPYIYNINTHPQKHISHLSTITASLTNRSNSKKII